MRLAIPIINTQPIAAKRIHNVRLTLPTMVCNKGVISAVRPVLLALYDASSCFESVTDSAVAISTEASLR
jgi:hypothetical protein